MTLKINLEPILSVEHVSEAASMAEIMAACYIKVAFADLQIDPEPFSRSYIDALLDDGLDENTLDDYTEEPAFALGEAKETFESQLVVELTRRASELGAVYPFKVGTAGDVILERKNKYRLSPVAIAYLFFRAFKLTHGVENYLSFTSSAATVDGLKKFRTTYERIFEITACYALAAKSEGAVWLSGQHRGSTAFLPFLNEIATFIGSGEVKTRLQLSPEQTGVNDGGIDGISFETRQGLLTADTSGFMLQATIQKSNRTNKILDDTKKQRVLRFFVTPPAVPFQGVMAIPFEQNLAEKHRCASQSCIYLPEAEILSLIGNVTPHPEFRKNVKELNRQMRSESSKFFALF